MDDQLKQLYDILPNCSCDDFKSAVKKIQSMADDENFLDACLLRAAGHGRLDIISLIYEEFDHPYMGREECFPNCAGETPLLLAAGRGDEKIVKYLLEHKANPFAVDSHGCNAAINAIASGNVELARCLIEDCLIAWQGYTWEGTSALQFSLTSRSPRMFGYILSRGGLEYNHPRYGGEEGVDDYPLLRSAGWDNKTKSPKWIKMQNGRFKRILANYQTNDCSEICQAAELGDFRRVKRLINSYEYPLVPDLLVCSACRGGEIDIFHYFINELHFCLPENALAHAITGGNKKLVAELIYEHDQNIYQTTASGETLLHLAVRDGKRSTDTEYFQTLSIIQTDLLAWGRLDPNAICDTGSVLDLACQQGDFQIVKILVNYGADIDIDAACAAAYCNNMEILNFFLDKNSNLQLDMQGKNGTTLLHEAVKGNAQDTIDYLVKNGARFDIFDHDGMSAKQIANLNNIVLTK